MDSNAVLGIVFAVVFLAAILDLLKGKRSRRKGAAKDASLSDGVGDWNLCGRPEEPSTDGTNSDDSVHESCSSEGSSDAGDCGDGGGSD